MAQASLNHHMLRHQEEKARQTYQFDECSKSLEGQNTEQNDHERTDQDVVKSDQGATLVQVEIVASQSVES